MFGDIPSYIKTRRPIVMSISRIANICFFWMKADCLISPNSKVGTAVCGSYPVLRSETSRTWSKAVSAAGLQHHEIAEVEGAGKTMDEAIMDLRKQHK
jgi:hypothetical protein